MLRESLHHNLIVNNMRLNGEADVTTPTIRKHVTTAQMSSQKDEDEVSQVLPFKRCR